MVGEVLNAFENDLMVLKRAFDTVSYQIILDKLFKLGVTGVEWKWFQNYLSDRNQYVQINKL